MREALQGMRVSFGKRYFVEGFYKTHDAKTLKDILERNKIPYTPVYDYDEGIFLTDEELPHRQVFLKHAPFRFAPPPWLRSPEDPILVDRSGHPDAIPHLVSCYKSCGDRRLNAMVRDLAGLPRPNLLMRLLEKVLSF